MIRILIAERIRVTRDLIGLALESEPDLTIAGMVATPDQAATFLQSAACDLVLVGAAPPSQEALSLVRLIRRHSQDIYIVVTGLPETPSVILPYIEAGASGFVLRTEGVPELLQTIRSAVQNKALISPEMAALLMEEVAHLSARLAELTSGVQPHEELTEREREVLDLVVAGRTNQEIADTLVIEVGTVKNHVHNILAKLKVHSRRDAGVSHALLHSASEVQHGKPLSS